MQTHENKIKKLFTLTPEEAKWLDNYKHENKFPSENAAIKALIHDKMNHTKNTINKFFSDGKMREVMKELADK